MKGICRYLWFQRFREIEKDENKKNRPNSEADWIDPEIKLVQKDQNEQLNLLLGQLPIPCRKVLELWKLGYSMDEIAQRVGYKSAGVARKKKYQCMQKLMQLIETHPGWKNVIR